MNCRWNDALGRLPRMLAAGTGWSRFNVVIVDAIHSLGKVRERDNLCRAMVPYDMI